MSTKRRSRTHHTWHNPVTAAILKSQIQRDVRSLKTDAMLHALIGANDAKLIDNAGRMAYITADAARASQISETDPDMRILHGMARALGELANGDGDRELHRLSISSGLTAAERLLPRCSVWAIGTAAIKLDELLATTEGLTVFHITKPTPQP